MKVIANRVMKVLTKPPVQHTELDLTDPYIYKYLLDPKYQITVPFAYLLSEEEIVNQGIPDGEGYDKNNPFNHNPTVASVNIIKLSQLYNDSAPFSLCHMKDALEIVRIINTYLYRWREYLKDPASVFEEPPDEALLYSLDAYKNHLMMYASYVDKSLCKPVAVRQLTTGAETPSVPVDTSVGDSSMLTDILQMNKQRQYLRSGNLY